MTKYIILEEKQGYWDKDGCIPGIENGSWVQTGRTLYKVYRNNEGRSIAMFETKKQAQEYIKNRSKING